MENTGRDLRRRHTGAIALVLLAVSVALPGTHAAANPPPEVDYTLVFDGTSGMASAGTGVDVIPTGSGVAFTVEAWVFDPVLNDNDWRHVMSQGQGGTAFYLGTNKDSQQIRAGDKWASTGVDLPVGRWVHIALSVAAGTVNAQTAKLYLDGQLEAQTATFGGPTVSIPEGHFRLGTQRTVEQFWNGSIDTVRVWDVERSQAQIAGAMHTALPKGEPGLTAQYLANEGTGTTVVNTAADGLDLTLSGGVTWETVASTTTSGTDTIVTFPRSAITAAGGWSVPAGFTRVDVLAVAGGGGGGASVGGGGGAGGVVETPDVAVTDGQIVAVTVGVGGRGATNSAVPFGFSAGSGGQNSSFGTAVVATGGGVGASWTLQAAGAGGSGGGGSQTTGTYAGAAGVARQGYAGGNAASNAQPHPAGGGGGAGGVGQVGPSATESGAGGPGRTSTITGTAVVYAGGGGGGSHGTWDTANDPDTFTTAGTAGAGGAGGGGDGGAATAAGQTVRGQNGTAGLGGGGGGAGNNCGDPCQTSVGGRGGSGVVVVRLAQTGLSCKVPFLAQGTSAQVAGVTVAAVENVTQQVSTYADVNIAPFTNWEYYFSTPTRVRLVLTFTPAVSVVRADPAYNNDSTINGGPSAFERFTFTAFDATAGGNQVGATVTSQNTDLTQTLGDGVTANIARLEIDYTSDLVGTAHTDTTHAGTARASLLNVLLDGCNPTLSPAAQTINGQVDVAVPASANLTASGFDGAVTFAVTTGTLPAGLTLDPATGVVSGVPTAAQTATVIITGTGAVAGQATATITFNVAVPAGEPPPGADMPAVHAGVDLACLPRPVAAGGLVDCVVSGGPAAAVMLWQVTSTAGFDAEGDVTLDRDGRGTFAFVAPNSPDTLHIALVGWPASDSIGVVAGDVPIPTGIPAGGGSGHTVFGLLAVLGMVGLLARRWRTRVLV